MMVLAHLTSFDLPSLAVAFAAGVAVGMAVVGTVMSRRGR